jgi:hypothetical protein
MRYKTKVGSTSIREIWSKLSICPSFGAWITITVEPNRHNTQPVLLKMFRFSFKYLFANIADIKTLKAPKGVTSEAGAKAYAQKLAISPIPTSKQ